MLVLIVIWVAQDLRLGSWVSVGFVAALVGFALISAAGFVITSYSIHYTKLYDAFVHQTTGIVIGLRSHQWHEWPVAFGQTAPQRVGCVVASVKEHGIV